MIPLAAHLRSRLLATFVMFLPIEEMFLCAREELVVGQGCRVNDLLLVASNELQSIFLTGDVVDGPD